MADIFTDAGEDVVADLVDGTASAPANWYCAWGLGRRAGLPKPFCSAQPSSGSQAFTGLAGWRGAGAGTGLGAGVGAGTGAFGGGVEGSLTSGAAGARFGP